MNSPTELNSRLLRLFPVEVLKKEFQLTKKTRDEIIEEIVRSQSSAAIEVFVKNNFEYTKQHVFLYKGSKGFQDLFSNSPSILGGTKSTISKASGTIFTLINQEHEVILAPGTTTNYSKKIINYPQPCKIEIEKDLLKVRLTILERNPANSLQKFNVVKFKRIKDDFSIIERIVADYSKNLIQLNVVDINKGIKWLWDKDYIDAKYVKYKRHSSTATETMDEDFTLKVKYPGRYSEIIQTPLRKHAFRFLIDTQDHCDFETDPTGGQIAFNKYSSKTQVNNVIDKITSNN